MAGARDVPDPLDDLETNPRFPSGPWRRYYEQRESGGGGRGQMELGLIFRKGQITGARRDPVGTYTMDGPYDVESGRCSILKRYPTHKVDYHGYSEGKGIWGQWKISALSGLVNSHGLSHLAGGSGSGGGGGRG